MARLSDISSKDSFGMDSESKSDEDDPDVGSMEEQTGIKWEF